MKNNSAICEKIRVHFPELAILKSRANDSLFSGRSLPSFVKDYIIRKHSDNEGNVNRTAVAQYLDLCMPDAATLRSRLLLEGSVKLTTRFIVKSDLEKGRIAFSIPDAEIVSNAYISQAVLQHNGSELKDGECWGAITLEYITPRGKEAPYILMSEFKSFRPYRPSIDYLCQARNEFTLEEWVDLLIASMEYTPESFGTMDTKLEFLTRLLPFVEPRTHLIELGPKGTSKSYIFSNFSKYAWLLGGGKTSRARLFHNFRTGQHGAMMFYDAVAIDEISTFSMSDPEELESIFKCFLEEGVAKLEKINLRSECGLVLLGNIKLSEQKLPLSHDYYAVLPKVFRSSALLDRFSGFIEGWKLPRMTSDSILQGWTLNTEYISTVLHLLRTESVYGAIFDEIVLIQPNADLRDNKAVKRLATAYCKLLFPNMRCAVAELDPESQKNFKALYLKYCLEPAVNRRRIIREQLHLMDKEFAAEMSVYTIVPTIEEPKQTDDIEDEVDDFGVADTPEQGNIALVDYDPDYDNIEEDDTTEDADFDSEDEENSVLKSN